MLAASSQHAQASRLPAGARFRGASRPGWARCERRPCLGRPGRPTGRRLAAAGGSPAPARWAAAHGRCWGPVHAPQRRPQAGPADPRRPGRQLPLVRRRRRCRPAAAEGAWQRRTATIRRRSIAGRGRAGDTESLRSLGPDSRLACCRERHSPMAALGRADTCFTAVRSGLQAADRRRGSPDCSCLLLLLAYAVWLARDCPAFAKPREMPARRSCMPSSRLLY